MYICIRKNIEEIVIDKKNIYMYMYTMVYVCTGEPLFRSRTENRGKYYVLRSFLRASSSFLSLSISFFISSFFLSSFRSAASARILILRIRIYMNGTTLVPKFNGVVLFTKKEKKKKNTRGREIELLGQSRDRSLARSFARF